MEGLSGRVVGGYTLVENIGSGAMGDVYRGTRSDGAQVAIKLLNAVAAGGNERKRFLIEASAVNRIAHPGVVKVLESGYVDQRPYLIMELLVGESLETALARGARPLLAILDEVLDAMGAAHKANIVHRDLKPGNIWLSRDGGVRVLDFGVAKLLDGSAGVTRTGAMIGTPAYMAPEQIVGGAIDVRADLYAVGVLAFELASGVRPYVGTSPFAIAQQHVSAPIPRLPASSPSPAQAFIDRAMAKDPAKRFQSADEMRAGLRGWPGALPALAPRRGLGSKLGVALGAVGLAAGVTLAVVATFDGRPSKPDGSRLPALTAQEQVVLARYKVLANGGLDEFAARPYLGPVTEQRRNYRIGMLRTFYALGGGSGNWFVAERVLPALEAELATWGTSREKYAFGSVGYFDVDGFPGGKPASPAAPVTSAVSDPTNPFLTNPTMSDLEQTVRWRIFRALGQAREHMEIPFVGGVTSARFEQRMNNFIELGTLMNSEDWALAMKRLTAIEAEMAKWGTPAEAGATDATRTSDDR